MKVTCVDCGQILESVDAQICEDCGEILCGNCICKNMDKFKSIVESSEGPITGCDNNKITSPSIRKQLEFEGYILTDSENSTLIYWK